MTDDEKFLVGLLALIIVLIIGGGFALFAFEPSYGCSYETVQKIGACDKNGRCGVVTEKGVKYAQYPIIGEKACIWVEKGE